ncbi:hypothetical protein FSP39_006571 [Pinctada imbricata]|uniref:Endoplasmic reticulum-Golgi intermediate compartment protein 3 n=1 Tax=Pinctada imbricata TaxID=66713 RepID=A0AA88XLF9_PINIB|nr:hypothetical protein FSP39_006571 [Pinctada imbricata]
MQRGDILERLRHFDAYPKTLEDFRVKTYGGAIVTVISSIIMLTLFVSELNYYLTTDIQPELFVDTTRGQKIKININMTFNKIPCAFLSIDAMDTSGEQQLDVDHHLLKQRLDENGQRISDEPKKQELGDKSKDEVETTTKALDPERCESCYGAETPELKCCNTCEDVREAYRKKGWAFNTPENIEQCKREGWSEKIQAQKNEGCLTFGYLEVNKVQGNFHFAPGKSFQQHHIHVHDLQAFGGQKFNISHSIHHLSFGTDYPGIVNPLDNTLQSAEHDSMMFSYYIKVVPTTYVKVDGKTLYTNQYSVTKHSKVVGGSTGETGLPGAFFIYELSPMMVKYTEKRRSFMHFLTGVCAIIGGVFTDVQCISVQNMEINGHIFFTLGYCTSQLYVHENYISSNTEDAEMENEWQTGRSLAECNKYMLTHQVACDITFCIGSNSERVHAHKYVLGSRSSVFYAMLYGPMASAGEIHITDIEIEAFQCFLSYIYAEEVPLTGENVLAVMHAANKYAMTGLEAECVDFLMENLSPENVCAVLECAHCFSRKELRRHCIEFIKDNPGAFDSEHFQHLCTECLSMILKLDALIIQEEDLYEYVMKWTDVQCASQNLEVNQTNRRHVLGNLIYDVRFPIMNQKFFSEMVVAKELLSTEETVDIISKCQERKSVQCQVLKTKKTRNSTICLMLYSKYSNGNLPQDTESMEVYAALENSDSDEVLTEIRKVVKMPRNSCMFKINFPRCIKLEPDIRYSIYVQKEDMYSNWGDGGMASVVSEGINFYFLTTYKSEQTNRAKGLLPGIVFCKLR